MKVQLNDRNRLIKICNHDAGHYIVSRELNFRTGGIHAKVNPFQGHSAGNIVEPWTPNVINVEDIIGYLERRIKVLYAGVISESMDKDGNYDSDYALNQWRNDGGKDDYAKIRELVQTLRNIKYPNTTNTDQIQQELDEIDNQLIQGAGSIVLERLELIQGIGETILSKIKEYNVDYEILEDEFNKIPKIKELYIDRNEQ